MQRIRRVGFASGAYRPLISPDPPGQGSYVIEEYGGDDETGTRDLVVTA